MIEFSQIEKRFFGVKVLKDVSFTAKPGQTIGIVGENGAGKSTLMNILGGNLRADAGLMRLNGQPYAPTSPGDAERAGIAFIHQELNLVPYFDAAENIFLGHAYPRHALGSVNWAGKTRPPDWTGMPGVVRRKYALFIRCCLRRAATARPTKMDVPTAGFPIAPIREVR